MNFTDTVDLNLLQYSVQNLSTNCNLQIFCIHIWTSWKPEETRGSHTDKLHKVKS